jgi:hypothetical protein
MIGKNLLKSGVEVLGDLQENKKFRSAVSERGREFLTDMKESVLSGKGYIRKNLKNIAHSKLITCRDKTIKKKKEQVKKASKKKNKQLKDCFGKFYHGIYQ